ncbi:putative toxin-antitoxin system toxin component, PIN family [Arhodomonas sp. SL1]|uniref:putative toxin-antitoxin system toxin component, PIN family n=1 Tax=Arhodomonas sp. SL1 TaxID=3425691 RepID=UPI003F885135
MVVDTNVLVAALINPAGTPTRLLDEIRTQTLEPVVEHAILAEYREVLSRPRFGFPHSSVNSLIEEMTALSLVLRPAPIDTRDLPDPDDALFIAVALAAACPIVTGNRRHFPQTPGLEVLGPTECLERVNSR